MFWVSLGEVLPVAMAIAVAPTAIVSSILLVLGTHGRSAATLFALGWAVAIGSTTAVAYALLEAVAEPDAGPTDTGLDLVQLAIGLLFWGIAAVTWRSRSATGAPTEEPKALARLDTLSPIGALGFGLVQGVVIVKNIPLSVGAGARLAQSPLDGGQAVIAVVVFAVLASAGALAPVITVVIGGDRARQPLLTTRRWLLDNLTPIMLTILILIGGVLIGRGIGFLS